MKTIENEVNVGFDVDGTLIRPATREDKTDESMYPNGRLLHIFADNTSKYYLVHTEHVELLKSYRKRGFYVIVWSANGHDHAGRIVRALNLEDSVDLVMTKCMKHVDDRKDIEGIVGSHVFIPMKGF